MSGSESIFLSRLELGLGVTSVLTMPYVESRLYFMSSAADLNKAASPGWSRRSPRADRTPPWGRHGKCV